jgi:hypothetical protein
MLEIPHYLLRDTQELAFSKDKNKTFILYFDYYSPLLTFWMVSPLSHRQDSQDIFKYI